MAKKKVIFKCRSCDAVKKEHAVSCVLTVPSGSNAPLRCPYNLSARTNWKEAKHA